MSQPYQLAQINIAKAMAPIDDPLLAGFVSQIEHINTLAEASPGFVWRLKDEYGDATNIHAFDDPLILVNMSVWASLDALRAYVYSGDHLSVVRQRHQWFHKPEQSPLALWWVPAGHQPTPAEGRARLEQLWRDGPSPDVFTFAKPYPAPDAALALA